MTNVITEILNENTDEIMAIVITTATLASYFLDAGIPTEPMMIIIGYYFHKTVRKP